MIEYIILNNIKFQNILFEVNIISKYYFFFIFQ